MKDLNNGVEADKVTDKKNASKEIIKDSVKSESIVVSETIPGVVDKAIKLSGKKEVEAKAIIEVKKSQKKENPKVKTNIQPDIEDASKTETIDGQKKTEPTKKKDKKIKVINKKAKKAEEKVDKLKKKVKKAKEKEVKKSKLKSLKEKLNKAFKKLKRTIKKLKKAKN